MTKQQQKEREVVNLAELVGWYLIIAASVGVPIGWGGSWYSMEGIEVAFLYTFCGWWLAFCCWLIVGFFCLSSEL